jgi:N-acetylglucosaminyldiphosphoundecaprenol N-acetyl-beta-D-mannosaminyltransferase
MSAECPRAITISGQSVEAATFLGIKIHLLTSDDLLHLVSDCITAQRKVVIANHNLHSLCLYSGSSRDAVSFRRFYEDAQYTLADGMSIVVLGKLKRQRISSQHRVAYNDWLPFMLPIAVQKGWRVFYLGSTSDVAETGSAVLHTRFPGLQWSSHHGHFDAEYHSDSNKKVVAEISRYNPHILFVGMGMPRQERWIQENRSEIEANVILPSGATLDYIAGAKRMAPRWMGSLGLEWAFRLATEPRRLAHRYLVEPWSLLSAVVTNSLEISAEPASPIRPESTTPATK